jgi:SAM-dependent methyltransferase
MDSMSDDKVGFVATCNVCGSERFEDFRSRKNARCVDCLSLERTRVLKLALDHYKLVRPGMRVLHLAPDAGIGRYIKRVVGDELYEAYDLKPSIYSEDLNVRPIDLVTDAAALPSEHYDLVLHMHVMEHIPCNVTAVLWHLHRALRPSGRHVFCLPVMTGNFAEDLGPLTREQREQLFGQFDHCRRFGRDDLHLTLGMIFRLRPFDCARLVPSEVLATHAIPPYRSAPSSNTIYVQWKNDLLLA